MLRYFNKVGGDETSGDRAPCAFSEAAENLLGDRSRATFFLCSMWERPEMKVSDIHSMMDNKFFVLIERFNYQVNIKYTKHAEEICNVEFLVALLFFLSY